MRSGVARMRRWLKASGKRGEWLHDPNDRWWRIVSVLLVVCVTAVSVATIGDYGVTWDEEYRKEYGVVLLNWYSSWGADKEALTKWNLYYIGGFFDTVAQLATRFSPHGVYETRHAVNTLFGLLGIAGTYGIGSQVAGAAGGFFSALFLVLTPAYYGQMFNNPKDIPFAALFAVSLFSMLRSVRFLPSLRRGIILQMGCTIGLTMGVRIAGIGLLAYLAILWVGWLVCQWWTKSIPNVQGVARAALRLIPAFLAVAVLAWLVMLAVWPWAFVSPFRHPLEALTRATGYDWPLTVFFDGRFIQASELPWTYLPTWLAISLPEFYFVALGTGCVLAGVGLPRFARAPRRVKPPIENLVLLIAAFAPIIAAILLHSTIYDGLRQYLFVLPAFAALAGISLARLLAARIQVAARLAVVGVVGFSATLTVFDMVDLHPYQYVYFNRLMAGGLESASARFETDYYGASYREGVRWLIENYPTGTGEKVRVANPSRNFLTAYYLEANQELRDRFLPVQPWDNPHIYISITRWGFHKEKEGRLLHVVSRKGVPLLYVIEVRPPGTRSG